MRIRDANRPLPPPRGRERGRQRLLRVRLVHRPGGDDALTVAAQGIPRGVPYFHVGIGPFIAASIAMQVLVAVVPSLKELTKDQVGQHTVKQYTRYLTFVVAVVQSILAAAELPPVRHPRAGDALLPHRRSHLHHGRGDRGVAGGRDDQLRPRAGGRP